MSPFEVVPDKTCKSKQKGRRKVGQTTHLGFHHTQHTQSSKFDQQVLYLGY